MDPKKYAPATARNRDPILAVLQEVLPKTGSILEIACGSGEHAIHFAKAFPEVKWLPSDIDPTALASTRAWVAELGCQNIAEPQRLDVTDSPWPVEAVAGVICINMLHISPWSAAEGLFRGAAEVLLPEGVLVTYGPYKVNGVHTAPSNKAFDLDLRTRDHRWGIRDVGELDREARKNGLSLERQVHMPANNFCLVFRKSAS